MSERDVNVFLRFILDRSSAQQVRNGTLSVKDALKQVESQAARTKEKMEKLGQVGNTLAVMGGAIVAPLMLAARSYVQYAGRVEETSAKWLASQKRLEQAKLRIGRAVAKEIVPYMEMAAKWAEKLADAVEKNPQLVEGLLKVGGVVMGLGAAVSMLAKLASTLAVIKGLLASIQGTKAAGAVASVAGQAAGKVGMLGKLGAAGLGTAAAVTASVGAGLMLGGAAYNALKAPEADTAQATGGKFATILAYGAGQLADKVTGSTDKTAKWSLAIGQLTGVIDDATAADIKRANGLEEAAKAPEPMVSEAAMTEFTNHQKQLAAARKQYESQQTQIVVDANKQRADATRQYEAQRTAVVKDFAREQARAQDDFSFNLARQARDFRKAEQQAEKDYYKQRSQAAKAHGVETKRMEEDHQKEMRQARKAHDRTMEDLGAQRDALGMAQEMRRYEEQRQEQEDAYVLVVKRRNEDYAAQLVEMERAFAEQRTQRIADYEQRLADQKEDFARTRARQLEDHNRRLAEMDEQHKIELEMIQKNKEEKQAELTAAYNEEIALLKTEFINRMGELDGTIITDYNAYVTHLKGISTQFRSWLTGAALTLKPTTTMPTNKRASGGYAGYGMYTLGEAGTEYVLDAATTRYAEEVAGGRLTQGRLRQMMSATLQQNFSFNGSFSESERMWFRQTAYDQALAAVGTVMA